MGKGGGDGEAWLGPDAEMEGKQILKRMSYESSPVHKQVG